MAVLLEALGDFVAHLFEIEEGLPIGTDEDDGDLLLGRRSRSRTRIIRRLFEKADIHVQVAAAVERWEAEWDPVLAAPGLDAPRLEQHIKDQL